jgi:diguanylate cyclase (GGDEF)-like protein
MARDDAARVRLMPAHYARLLSAGVLATYVLVVAAAFLLRGSVAIDEILSGPALFSASLLAGLTCFAAWRLLPQAVNVPWVIFGLAGLTAAISHVGASVGVAAIHFSFAASYALFVAGIVTSIQQSERGRWPELGMDATLVVAAATLMMLRWSPAIQQTLDTSSVAAGVLVLFGPVMSFCAALFMIVLLVSPPASLPRSATFALSGATLCMMISALPQVLSGSACCHNNSPATAAAIGMWVFLLAAGASAVQSGGSGIVVPQGERLRQFVAPTVAVILAAISIDTSLNPPAERRTAIAIGVLAVLLALRLTQLLQATRTLVAERRELAQTRALMEVSRALSGANDLDDTLKTVTTWAQRVLNAKASCIELLSPDGLELEMRATSGLPTHVVGQKYSLDRSFTGSVVKTGELRVSVNAGNDPLIGVESRALLGEAPLASVPLRYRERILGVLSCIGSRPFNADDLELLRAFASQAAIAIEDARLFEQVRMLSVTDALTGLANRRRLDRELEREFAAARRGRRLVAVMFDLNDFKQHNDRYGHLAGDRALKHFADALNESTRAMNLAARFGGDEFFALLADADRAGADIFVQRVSDRFEEIMRETGNPPLHVSAGIAEFRPDMNSSAELVEAADRALYISKSEPGTSR